MELDDHLSPLPDWLDFDGEQGSGPPEAAEVVQLDSMAEGLIPLPTTYGSPEVTHALHSTHPPTDAVANPSSVLTKTDVSGNGSEDQAPLEPLGDMLAIWALREPREEMEERVEREAEIPPPPDAKLQAIVEGLRRDTQHGKEPSSGADVARPRIGTAESSPLSDLPDLPTELPPSPDMIVAEIPLARRRPAPSFDLESSDSHAESSRTAQQRSKVSGTKRKAKGRAREAAVKAKARMDLQGEDDLESLLEDEERFAEMSPARSGKQGPKRSKSLNGAAARRETNTPRRKRLKDDHLDFDRHDQPPGKVTPKAKVFTDEAIIAGIRGKPWERQMAPCVRPRYGKWGKCTQCVAKKGGDSCRFRDYRVFPVDPNSGEILGPGVFESTELTEEVTPLPTAFNIPLEAKHVLITERTVAPILLPLITHFCSSTIFAGYWFCRKCGRDFCLQCERYFADASDTMGISPWPIPNSARTRLYRCNAASTEEPIKEDLMSFEGKAESKKPVFHFRPDLQPVSRFSEAELREHWRALAEFVLAGDESAEDVLHLLGVTGEIYIEEAIKAFRTERAPQLNEHSQTAISPQQVERLYTKATSAITSPPFDPAGLENESLPFMRTSVNELDDAEFDHLWSRGEPMVVDDVGARLKMAWTPDEIIKRFGAERCHIQDCQRDVDYPTTVGEFFEIFKHPETRGKSILKLKDWPATEDFQRTHPGLYNDFCGALPVPSYTRREGVLNLYSHFPPGPTKPDIGPKMYNAFAAVEDAGGFGSTRLHMDVADAINVMLYASPRHDGTPGCAVWDLFRAEDASKIREFLASKFDKTKAFTDPIHAQLFYLDAALRRELYAKHGVVSFRVYQYPGQAVFIPAGCAHQVCNLADCIKIALDFVSPHNVVRCQQLTRDFRDENFVKAWKQDVLQLHNVLWFAWLSSRQTRERWDKEAEERRMSELARQKRLEALQNGEHADSPMGSPHVTAPRALGSGYSAAVSSVRDEVDISRTSSPDQKRPIMSGGTIAFDMQNGDIFIAKPDDLQEATQAGPVARDALVSLLLSAALTAPDPPPPPGPRQPSSGTKIVNRGVLPLEGAKSAKVRTKTEPGFRSGRSSSLRASRKPMKELCRTGQMDVDLMIGVVRSQMGAGADTYGAMMEAKPVADTIVATEMPRDDSIG